MQKVSWINALVSLTNFYEITFASIKELVIQLNKIGVVDLRNYLCEFPGCFWKCQIIKKTLEYSDETPFL